MAHNVNNTNNNNNNKCLLPLCTVGVMAYSVIANVRCWFRAFRIALVCFGYRQITMAKSRLLIALSFSLSDGMFVVISVYVLCVFCVCVCVCVFVCVFSENG